MANETVVTTTAPHIFTALVAVSGELVKVGIAKDRKNEQQGFKFRGIDDAMNTVSPILSKHDVVFLPTYEDYPDTERVTGKGSTLIFAKVKGIFTFVSAKDASSVTVTTFGVAMDSGDKATNKAMSAALKYALLQTFLIPTEGEPDADATTQEPSIPKPPAGLEDWYTDLTATADTGWDPLASAWRESKKVFRDYVLAYRKLAWEATKAKARGISDATKGPAA
jgi:hypothetical protein